MRVLSFLLVLVLTACAGSPPRPKEPPDTPRTKLNTTVPPELMMEEVQ